MKSRNLYLLLNNWRFFIVFFAALAYSLLPDIIFLLSLLHADQSTLSAAYTYFGEAQMGNRPDTYMLLCVALFPFLVSLAYADCNFSEKQYGCDKIMITQEGRRNYYSKQAFTVFLSGVLVILIPSIIEKLVFMTAFPLDSLKITPGYPLDPYINFRFISFWKPLFYNHPYLYFFLYSLITAFFGGMFALLSYSLSLHTRMNRFLVLTLPGICYFALDLLSGPYFERFLPISWMIPPFRNDGVHLYFLLTGAFVLLAVNLTALFTKIYLRRDEL